MFEVVVSTRIASEPASFCSSQALLVVKNRTKKISMVNYFRYAYTCRPMNTLAKPSVKHQYLEVPSRAAEHANALHSAAS